MRCVNCIWYDEENKECIIKGIKIFAPNMPRRCYLYNMVPEMAKNYVNGISNFTDLDPKIIRQSEPFKNFLRKMRMTRMN